MDETKPVFVPPDVPRDPHIIHTRSVLSHRTKRSMVIVEWNREAGQFTPEDARVFAHRILREADIAETDEFLYHHFQEEAGLNDGQLAVLITEFRRHRARLEQAAGLRGAGDPIPEEDAR